MGDRRIVSGGQREGLGREALAERESRRTAVRIQLGQQSVIVAGIGETSDVRVVLGCGAHHRRPADVDILDDRVAVGAALQRLQEWVEVDDDEIDRPDSVLLHCRRMFGIVAHAEKAAVHLRVQGLHAPVHHFGKAGQLADVADLGAQLAKLRRGAAGRDDVDAVAGEAGRELIEGGLVG